MGSKKLPQSARSADSPLFVEGAFGLQYYWMCTWLLIWSMQ